MEKEIELKYLIKELPFNPEQYPSKKIIQGYISSKNDETETRLRKKGDSFFLTIKKGSGIERYETEIQISQEQFSSLWQAVDNRNIVKTRYELPLNSLMIELDIFHENHEGLILAEVEFDSLEDAKNFSPPEWFSEDVSKNNHYKNKNLAMYGLPD